MIVVYKQLEDGKLIFTKEELEKLLEQAKQEGYSEGYKDGQSVRNNWITVPPYKRDNYYDEPLKPYCSLGIDCNRASSQYDPNLKVQG